MSEYNEIQDALTELNRQVDKIRCDVTTMRSSFDKLENSVTDGGFIALEQRLWEREKTLVSGFNATKERGKQFEEKLDRLNAGINGCR